jgi:hypothetical protein
MGTDDLKTPGDGGEVADAAVACPEITPQLLHGVMETGEVPSVEDLSDWPHCAGEETPSDIDLLVKRYVAFVVAGLEKGDRMKSFPLDAEQNKAILAEIQRISDTATVSILAVLARLGSSLEDVFKNPEGVDGISREVSPDEAPEGITRTQWDSVKRFLELSEVDTSVDGFDNEGHMTLVADCLGVLIDAIGGCEVLERNCDGYPVNDFVSTALDKAVGEAGFAVSRDFFDWMKAGGHFPLRFTRLVDRLFVIK